MTGREAGSPPAFASELVPRRSHIATPPNRTTATSSQTHQRLLRAVEFSVVYCSDFLGSVKTAGCSVTRAPLIRLLKSALLKSGAIRKSGTVRLMEVETAHPLIGETGHA